MAADCLVCTTAERAPDTVYDALPLVMRGIFGLINRRYDLGCVWCTFDDI